jgi:HK97 family phage major capsid protein
VDLKQLYEARAKAVHDARQILDRADKAKRDLTADEAGHYQRLDEEIDRLGEAIAKQEQAAAAKNRKVPPAQPGTRGGDGAALTIDYPAGWNVQSMLRGRRARQNVLRPGSGEHLRAQPKYEQAFLGYVKTGKEQLGLQVSKDTKGGFLAPTTWVAELIKAVDDQVFVRQLARVLPALSESVSLGVPSRDSRLSTGTWQAEIPASDLTEDDGITVGKRELMPHLAMWLVKVGNKLLRSSSINADGFVRDELAYAAGTTLENAYFTGTGDQQPLGMFVASDMGVPTSRDITASSATNFAADDLINLLFGLKPQYQANATGIFSREFVKRARKLKDGTGQYLWQPGLAGVPSTILERPYIQSEFVPSTYTTGLYVGMFADLQAGYWIVDSLQMEVQVLVELLSLRNQTGYVGRLETDGMPVLPEAFSRLKLG